MPKRIPITLVFMIGMTASVLLANTEVRAFNDVANAPKEKLTIGGWTVELLSILELPESLFAWNYQISGPDGTASGLNNAAILVPDCERTPEIQIDVNHNFNSGWNDYFPVGQGTPKGFGSDNLQARVLEGSPANSSLFTAVVDTKSKDVSTILLNVRKLGALRFEMVVPGCTTPEAQILTAATVHEVCENNVCCRVRIDTGAEGTASDPIISLVTEGSDPSCNPANVSVVPPGLNTYGNKTIVQRRANAWWLRTNSPGQWCFTLANGEDACYTF